MARILIVDDDPENREVLRTRLEMAGHEVTEANNGEEGLSMSFANRPELIFLDVMMPKLDGWQVCRRLKADPVTKDIPVIMLTACSKQIEELRGYESGADDYVTKPWDLDRVTAILSQWLPPRDRTNMGVR